MNCLNMHLDEKNSTEEKPKNSKKPNPKLKHSIGNTRPHRHSFICSFSPTRHLFVLGKIY